MIKQICKNCKIEFEITQDDMGFYERMKVPPPTFCWKCRFSRRLAWRNERSLHKRDCDLCKKNIISMYKAGTVFPVYCHECWWGDNWSPIDYNKDYDFSQSFFEQFKELQDIVPKPALYESANTNSDYCNHTAHMKDSYLVFGSWFSENCSYGQTLSECKDCWDSIFIKKCEFCYSSADCTNCHETHLGKECTNCISSAFLYDCRNCQNCIFSTNLRNKNYCVFNEQVSKEEYEKIKSETFSSYESYQKAIKTFKEMVEKNALHKFMTGEQNYDVSGNFIYNSKNVHNSFFAYEGENTKYVVRGFKQRDSMDIFGVNAGELAYDSNNVDFSSNVLFSINGENNFNTEYTTDSFNVKNTFGCISLRKKEYCILNKEYTKNEYDELIPKIKQQMKAVPYTDKKGRIYSYGELFPIENAPFAYNESLAQDYSPITKEKALENNYQWHEVEDKGHVPTKNWKELPETKEADNSIISEIILCEAWDRDKNKAQEHGCTKAFKITPNELMMHKRWNIPLPRKCPNTRNFELFQSRNPVELWHRSCMKEGCSNEFETSYAPDRSDIIYCESCYQHEVY